MREIVLIFAPLRSLLLGMGICPSLACCFVSLLVATAFLDSSLMPATVVPFPLQGLMEKSSSLLANYLYLRGMLRIACEQDVKVLLSEPLRHGYLGRLRTRQFDRFTAREIPNYTSPD